MRAKEAGVGNQRSLINVKAELSFSTEELQCGLVCQRVHACLHRKLPFLVSLGSLFAGAKPIRSMQRMVEEVDGRCQKSGNWADRAAEQSLDY